MSEREKKLNTKKTLFFRSLTSQSKRYKKMSDDLSWFDVLRSDQTTNDAWSRIKRRLEPNQQKHILRLVNKQLISIIFFLSHIIY